MTDLITVFVSVLAFIGFVFILQAHASKVDATYAEYEKCVLEKYGTLPSTIYQTMGSVPECK